MGSSKRLEMPERQAPAQPDGNDGTATGLPSDAGALLQNNPDIREAVRKALPEWSQRERDTLVCEIGKAVRDAPTVAVMPRATWLTLLAESPPDLSFAHHPGWWVERRIHDVREERQRQERATAAAARASPRGQPKYGPRLPSDGEGIKVDQWGQVIDE